MRWATCLVLISIVYGSPASDIAENADSNTSSEDHQSAESIIDEIERVNNLTYKSAANNFPQHGNHSRAGFQRNLMVVLPVMQGVSNMSDAKLEMLYTKEPITTVIYTEGTPETLTDLGEQYKDANKNVGIKKSSRNKTQRKDHFHEWNPETGYLSKPSEKSPLDYGYPDSLKFVRELNELPKNHKPDWVSPEAYVTTTEVSTDFPPESTSSPFEIFKSVKPLEINKLLSTTKLKPLAATSPLTTEVENATTTPSTEEEVTTKRRYSTRTKKKPNNRYSVPASRRPAKKPSVKYGNGSAKIPSKSSVEQDQQPYKFEDATTSYYSTKSTVPNDSPDGGITASNSNEIPDGSGKSGISNKSTPTYDAPNQVRMTTTPSYYDINQKFTKHRTKQLESRSTSSASTFLPTVLSNTKSSDNLSSSIKSSESSIIPFEVAPKFLPTPLHDDEVVVDISGNQLQPVGVKSNKAPEIGGNKLLSEGATSIVTPEIGGNKLLSEGAPSINTPEIGGNKLLSEGATSINTPEIGGNKLPSEGATSINTPEIGGNKLLSEGTMSNHTSEISKNNTIRNVPMVKVENVTFSQIFAPNNFSNLTYSKKINENSTRSVDFSDVNKPANVPASYSIPASTNSSNFSKSLQSSVARLNSSDIFASPEPIKVSTETNKFSVEPFNSKLNEIYKFLNHSVQNIKLSKSAEPMNFPNIDKLLNDYNIESASYISKSKSSPADKEKVSTTPIPFHYPNKITKFQFGNEKHSSNINAFPSDILTPEMKTMLSSLGLYKNDHLFPITPTTPSPLTTIAGNEIPFEKIISENKPISPQIDPEAYANFKKIPTSYRTEKKYEAKISDDIKQYLISFGLLPREEKDPKEVILLRMSRGNNDRPRIGRNIAHKNLGGEPSPETKDSSNFQKLPQDVMESLVRLQLPTSFYPAQTKTPRADHVFSPSVYLEKLNNTDAGLKVNAAIESIRKLSENHNKSNLTIEEIKSQLENITSTLSTEELTELAFSNALDNVFNETYDNNSDISTPWKTNNIPSIIAPTYSSTTKLPYIVSGVSSKKGSNIADPSPIKKLNVIANLPNPLSSEELKQLYENSKNEIKRQQPTEKTQTTVPIVFGVLLPNGNTTAKIDKPTNPSDATHPSETLSSTEATEPLETPGSSASDSKSSSIDEPSSNENSSSAGENASSVTTENPSTTIENISTVTETADASASAENTTTMANEVSSTVDSSSLNSTSSRDSSSTDDASNSSSESSVPANPPLQELAESFGGGETASEAASVADLPSPRPNGLYFYVDWNSFLRVGDTNPVDLRFSPKAGNPRNFLNITFPYSAY